MPGESYGKQIEDAHVMLVGIRSQLAGDLRNSGRPLKRDKMN
jgi:hypothetical protein